MQADWSTYRGREAHERDGSELGAHNSFGSGDGQDDRLESPDPIDPDSLEQHGDFRNETCEFGENSPNEANFDKAISNVEPQDLIQVTAIPAARSRLDNDAARPKEDGVPEQAQAEVSRSASGDPKPRTPDSSDGVCERRSPETVSKRETRRLRLEKEQRAVERIVEEKLQAGIFSYDPIPKSVMALPP